MNQFKVLSMLVISLFLSYAGFAQTTQSEATAQKNSIEVIDFHTQNRCVTCRAIEANTKYTLETYFAKEIESGKITFQVLNLGDEKNKEIAKKFNASGTSLYLNVINNGEENQVNLTQFAFMNGKKKKEFSKKLKEKIEKELANI